MNDTSYKGPRDPINCPANQDEIHRGIIAILREFAQRGQNAQKACDEIIEKHKRKAKRKKNQSKRSKP
jgi:hypothetical protein